MGKDTVTMSMKQLNRFDILSKANTGFITVREASEALGQIQPRLAPAAARAKSF